MAKKNRLVSYKRRRAKKNATSMVMNPPIGEDMMRVIAPGLAAYASSRFLSRVTYKMTVSRWPGFAGYAHAAASVLTFGAAWFGAHRVAQLKPYHDAIVLGTGIAAVQTVAQTFVPKYAWILSDVVPGEYGTGNRQTKPNGPISTAVQPPPVADYFPGEDDDAGIDYGGAAQSYADSYGGGVGDIEADLGDYGGGDDGGGGDLDIDLGSLDLDAEDDTVFGFGNMN